MTAKKLKKQIPTKAKIISPKGGDQEVFLCMNEYNGHEVCKNVCKYCLEILPS